MLEILAISALVMLMSSQNEVLQHHITSPAAHNATYMSPCTQNELIQVIGTHIILQDLVDEIKAAKIILSWKMK